MIGLRKSYPMVAKEICDGLRSGSLQLERDPPSDEMGWLAGFLFRYLTPKKVAYVGGTTGALDIYISNPQIMIQIDPEEYENLPPEAKESFSTHTQELIDKGVKIKIKDLNGNIFYMQHRVDATIKSSATPLGKKKQP